MRKLFLGVAAAAALFAIPSKAETINCTAIEPPFPFVITESGIYCLRKDQKYAGDGNMIDIQTNHVTIDLNRFRLNGAQAGVGTSANGIYALNRKNVAIRNGTIRGFRRGVWFSGGASSGHLLEDLLLQENRTIGAYVEGSGQAVRNNRVVDTGLGDPATVAYGIFVEDASDAVVANNVVSGTSETFSTTGIRVLTSALIEVRHNTIFDTKDASASKRGVEIDNSTDVTVIGNRILNAAGTGTHGVLASGSSTSVTCIGNTIAGFATALSGCDFSAGNNLP